MGTGLETALIISVLAGAGSAAYSASQKPKISAPIQPTNVGTGNIIKTKSQTIDEEDIKSKDNKTKKAKLGNTQFQVKLKKKPKVGVNTTSDSGLNI